MVMLLFGTSDAPPKVKPLPIIIPAALVIPVLPLITEFLIVILEAASVKLLLPIQKPTEVARVLVF